MVWEAGSPRSGHWYGQGLGEDPPPGYNLTWPFLGAYTE